MVFLLFAVSLLLAIGGGAAALYGADTIRTETGSTLAVAGVAVTCAGLLMFALTACLSELRKIRRLVESGEATPIGAPHPLPIAPPVEVPAVTAAAVAAAVVAADRTTIVAAPRPEGADEPAESEAPVVVPSVDAGRAPDAAAHAPAPASAPVAPIESSRPEAGEWDPERPAHVPAAKGSAEDEVAPELAPAGAAEPKNRPTVPEPAPVAEPIAIATVEERELLATYTSGENTYFMYSDSAIEADTPQGRFRFASMEDLRAFVETGTGGMPLTPPPPRRD